MLYTDGPFFRDSYGRVVMLRGVNLSGGDKTPSNPLIYTHISKDFFESERTASFVNRPFPLSEADEHFSRLKLWGFNFIRLNITWEAIEHEGPGIYDMEFIEYLIKLLHKAKKYDFKCFIDPHQDVWSRFSGGSGAPGWTFKMAGLDITKFKETGAALVHNLYNDPMNFPKMIWPTNYFKLAAATMFTLFFGGKMFAPNCLITDSTNPSVQVNIQDFLQQHYINAILKVVERIHQEKELENMTVIGYDTLNEPHPGWIGIENINKLPEHQELRNGATPTPFECMQLGEGLATNIEYWRVTWKGPQKHCCRVFDPLGAKAWLDAESRQEGKYIIEGATGCIWAHHGVWDRRTRKLLKPNYFSINPTTGEKIDFLGDFFKPFVLRFSNAIRTIHTDAVIFIEPPVNEHSPKWDPKAGDPSSRLALAPHWYDGMTLINKKFNEWVNIDYLGFKRGNYSSMLAALGFGGKGIKRVFKDQLGLIKRETRQFLGNFPTVIGEIGIPYDMNDKKAYTTGNYSAQIIAMDANLTALEANLLSFTLWNYCSDNNNQWGDCWNGEDLSIFSRIGSPPKITDEVEDNVSTASGSTMVDSLSIIKFEDEFLNKGGRATAAFVRPYPIACPGTPLQLQFDLFSQHMIFTFEHIFDDSIVPVQPTDKEMTINKTHPHNNFDKWLEFFLPRQHFPSAEEFEYWVGHGEPNNYSTGQSGEWIINHDCQRFWWKCPCSESHLNNIILSTNSSLKKFDTHPTVRHTLIIRKKKANQKPMNEFATNLFLAMNRKSWSCLPC